MTGNEPGCSVSACNSWTVKLHHIYIKGLGKVYLYLCPMHWMAWKNLNLLGDRDL
jgi:hypothetical protein